MAEQTPSTTLDFLFQTVSDGIIVADSDTVIREINTAALTLLGEKPEALVGQRAGKVFERNPALVNLFLREGKQTLDVRLPRRRLAVGIASTLDDGRRIVLLHDVTEKRDLESRRESLIRAISHDMRSPISAITGFADLVGKFGELNQQQDKFLNRIRQTSAKLYDVIALLVDLAWIEAGMPLEHKPIQLRDVIDRAINRVTSLAYRNNIVIVTSLQNPLPTVMGDPVRLEQAVYNLLHNAVIYSLEEQTVVIHAWGDTQDVYCSVADQGIGIADDELDLVFDRMYRSRAEYVRNISGGGLGLTIVRTIIQRHGGDVWATSNLGEGSTFTFVLPTVNA